MFCFMDWFRSCVTSLTSVCLFRVSMWPTLTSEIRLPSPDNNVNLSNLRQVSIKLPSFTVANLHEVCFSKDLDDDEHRFVVGRPPRYSRRCSTTSCCRTTNLCPSSSKSFGKQTSSISMVAGVAVYPAGWSETAVQETCGPTADQYNIGRCHIRWAYLLAVIGCLDGIVLSALAFILATRHVRLQPDSGYPPPSLYKGEVNNGYVTDATSVSGSRKSLALQPVLIMHPHATMDMDTYSHYSGRTARSKHGIYANTMHNYQL